MDITERTLSPVGSAVELLRRVRQWPYVRVDLRGEDAALHCGLRDAFVGELDLLTGAMSVFVAADLGRSLVSAEPLLRLTRDGVDLDVVDDDSRRAAERLIRWRIDLERFGVQLREASP